VLEVELAEVVPEDALTDVAAQAAGYPDAATLRRKLDKYPDGDLYRITFHHAGDDPRLALRKEAALPPEEWAALATRLRRMDERAPDGPWTTATLEAIGTHPGLRAGDLAEQLGRERAPFKRDVRKLKELGLTESLEVGYRLSPRGRAALGRLTGQVEPAGEGGRDPRQ
jgi:hypothetical protein